MKSLLLLILLLFAKHTFANDTLITRLINSVYLNVVDSSFKYYNLYFNGRYLTLNSEDLINIKTKLNDASVSDFIDSIYNPNKDHRSINWCDYNIVKAKRFKSTYKKFAPPEFIMVSSKLSKSKQKTEYKRQDSIISNWAKEEYSFFVFSKPIFSNDSKFALVSLESHYGYIDPQGVGCYYLFKQEEGSWSKIFKGQCIAFTSYR